MVQQQPPTIARPLESDATREETIRDDDEILRQFQSIEAYISIWTLLASSTSHREALIKALSQIQVEISISPKGLIHMLTANRATWIVFFVDDLPHRGSNHTLPLYIFVGCSRH